MSVLGLIPARGGSKGIRGKNLVRLSGRPLLAYTAEAALRTRTLSRVIVSTDDDAIATAAESMGLEVPFRRPKELAEDDTPMLPVIVHALDCLETYGAFFGSVALLQPTSPLRTARHIDAAVDLMHESGAETVVSVVSVPHHFLPESLMRVEDGHLKPLLDRPMTLRRQDKAKLFARNGPAILTVQINVIRRGLLYGRPTIGYEMDARSSLDIDTPEDLWLAEQYLQRNDLAHTQ